MPHVVVIGAGIVGAATAIERVRYLDSLVGRVEELRQRQRLPRPWATRDRAVSGPHFTLVIPLRQPVG